MKSLEITKVIVIHPLGTLNICTKFHSDSTSHCQEISLKNFLQNWGRGKVSAMFMAFHVVM